MKDLVILKQVNPEIEVNFEEVKAELQSKLGEYTKLVVTEDSLSFCKSEKKHLAGLRKKMDTYRKDVKKEMSIPIKEFEEKCKELIGLVEETERPLQEGINVFDEQRKEEKKMFAIGEIARVINELGLNEKYASELLIDDKYMNLTAKEKEVIFDIETRANVLLIKQQREIEVIDTIKKTIGRVNKDITQQLEMRDFLYHIKSDKALIEIIAEIEKKANQVKNAEEEVKRQMEIKAKEEAERVRLETERKQQEEIQKAKEEAEIKVRQEVKKEKAEEVVEVVEPKIAVEEGVKLYSYTMDIKGTKEDLKALKQFMLDNNITFEVKVGD